MTKKVKTVELPAIGLKEDMVPTVVEAFEKTFGYQEEIPDPKWKYDEEKPLITRAPKIKNPMTKLQFVSHILQTNYMKKVVTKYTARVAAEKEAQRVSKAFE